MTAVTSDHEIVTEQPMVKMDEARVLKSSKLTFMVILIIWLILTVIVIGNSWYPIIWGLYLVLYLEI